MTTKISGDTGVSQCQPNSVSQDDLQASVVGKGPAFHAWQNVIQSGLPLETSVKMNFTTEVFDLDGSYDPTTSRFTPKVAGYYLIIGGFTANDIQAANAYLAAIHKNGIQTIGGQVGAGSAGAFATPRVVGILYMNGTTDYAEIYAYSANKAAWATMADQSFRSLFQAVLVRAA